MRNRIESASPGMLRERQAHALETGLADTLHWPGNGLAQLGRALPLCVLWLRNSEVFHKGGAALWCRRGVFRGAEGAIDSSSRLKGSLHCIAVLGVIFSTVGRPEGVG